MGRTVVIVGAVLTVAMGIGLLIWWRDDQARVMDFYGPPTVPFDVYCEQGIAATGELCLLAAQQAATDAGYPERHVTMVEISHEEGILVCWDGDAADGSDGSCRRRTLRGLAPTAPPR